MGSMLDSILGHSWSHELDPRKAKPPEKVMKEYRRLLSAMKAPDPVRVKRSQVVLMQSGWYVPVRQRSVEAILKRWR